MIKKNTSIFCVVSAVVSLFGSACQCDASVQRALLSVTPASTMKDDDLRVIKIDTWGVEFLAVCKIPSDWEIKVQKYADPAGSLLIKRDYQSGKLDRIDKFFLVDVYDYQPLAMGSEHPASFSGWAEFNGYRNHRRKRHPLKAGNFTLTPATNCPAFPPAAP